MRTGQEEGLCGAEGAEGREEAGEGIVGAVVQRRRRQPPRLPQLALRRQHPALEACMAHSPQVMAPPSLQDCHTRPP